MSRQDHREGWVKIKGEERAWKGEGGKAGRGEVGGGRMGQRMGDGGGGSWAALPGELGIAGLLKAESCAVCAKALFVLTTKHVGAAGVPPPGGGVACCCLCV